MSKMYRYKIIVEGRIFEINSGEDYKKELLNSMHNNVVLELANPYTGETVLLSGRCIKRIHMQEVNENDK